MSDESGWGFGGTILGLAVAVVVILVYVMQWHDCSETGGVLEQGAWWFSCVEPHKERLPAPCFSGGKQRNHSRSRACARHRR